MKRILTLVLCWLIAFSAMAETTFKAKTAASVAGGYVTSLNKVDGSFEDGSTQWSASVGTIVRTANTEMQGNYVGVWSGTGTGTLDLLWTATASNNYELSEQIKLDVPSDYTLCGVVNGIETGCKVLSGYVANKIYKASVFADSILGTSFYLRLKHTGAGAFSATVDDGKIEPYTLNTANLVKIESVRYGGYSTGTNPIVYKTRDASLSNNSELIAVSTIGAAGTASRYTVLRSGTFNTYASSSIGSGTTQLYISHYNSSGVLLELSDQASASVAADKSVSMSGWANIGDYFYVTTSTAPGDSFTNTTFGLTITSVSDNVIVTSQDGMANTATLSYTQVNALAGNQGLGTFTAGYVSYVKVGDSLHYSGSLTLGTTTSSEARIPLPNGYTVSQKSVPALRIAGKLSKNDSASSYFGSSVLIEGGNNFFQIGYQGSTINELTKSIGTNYASGSVVSFDATIPIAGWSSGPTVYALPASKDNNFSAFINSDGTVATKNLDWIASSVKNSTGNYTITFRSGLFTVAPVVSAMVNDNSQLYNAVVTKNSSSITVYTGTSGGLADRQFELLVQKQKPDYTPQGVVPMSGFVPDWSYDISGQLIGMLSVDYARATVQKLASGGYRVSGNIRATYSSASRSSGSITISGIASPSSSVPVVCNNNGTTQNIMGYTTASSGTLNCDHSTATTTGYGYTFSYDTIVKPTWATNTP